MEKKGNIVPLVKIPQKILRKKAADIPHADIRGRSVQHLIAAMKATLAATPDGVGLAAPQVGHSLRLFIVSEEAEEIDRSAAEIARRQRHETHGTASPEDHAAEHGQHRQRNWKYHVYINPVVKNKARRQTAGAEGCLSVPGKFGPVRRHEKITVEALDEHGKKFIRGSANFFARVVQHELDHLEGTLFIDKADEVMDVSSGEK